MRRRVDRPHRLLALNFFEGMRRQAGHTGNNQERVGYVRGEARVRGDRGNSAVDVHRQRAAGQRWMTRQCKLEGAQELRVLLVDLELVRELEQPARAGIDRVKAMAESGRRDLVLLDELLDQRFGRLRNGLT